ncbi:MAG: sialidase family protein [Bryobacteraceae bacterium]
MSYRSLCAAVCLPIAVWAAGLPVTFESKPRTVVSGRDPVLSVRASGAVSLLKVDGSNLWLHTSFDGGDSFEDPVRVNDVENEVSSHGESSPQMVIRSRGEFYVAWQSRRTPDKSVLRFARSNGWGESFVPAIDVDPEGPSSQSFFTMNVAPNGAIYVAWLDGRERGKGRPGTSAVYIARSTDKGATFAPPVRIALDVCPCCRPNIAFSSKGKVYVAWRGVLDGNVRDVFVASSSDQGATWSASARVAEDQWAINGCPHSGGAMATVGERLFISWYTVRDKQPRLYLAWSDDGGATFSQRTDVSGESVLDPNHPVLANTGDRIALIFQARDATQGDGWGPLDAYYREFDAQGTLSPLAKLGHAEASVVYPAFAFESPGRLFIAWTESGKEGKSVVMMRGRRAN